MWAVKISRMAAKSPSSVMLMGWTGTRKELFAQAIHNQSPWKKYPYIAIHCAAIPENLLEEILFWTAKGAFTGAMDKPGLFERTNGGTIFLDKINSMPTGLEAKLLRVLHKKKVQGYPQRNCIEPEDHQLSQQGTSPCHPEKDLAD